MDWLIPETPDELAELVRERAGRDAPALATGAPGPPEAVRRLPAAGEAVVLSTTALDGPPDLRPRDLTVSVPAGVRIVDLQRSLAEEGLWLAAGGAALDRSVGGAVAAGSSGPWDLSFGDLGRQMLACELVTWTGTRARWGRAVMKDVAGYGMTRAAVGSLGRLGVLHRAVFRVWPRPAAARAVELVPDDGDAAAAAGRLATSDVDARVRPDALRWTRGPAAGDGGIEAWLIGPEASVDERSERLAARAPELGLEAGASREGLDPARPAPEREPDPGRRSPGTSAATVRPGRTALGAAARRVVDALGEHEVRTAVRPLAGALRCVYRREGPPAPEAGGRGPAEEPPAPLGRLLEAAGEAPVRIERGSARELAAAERRRPPGARRLERRVLDALEGRPRHWLSGYL